MVIVQREFFFEFERGLTKCFEIVVYLFHYSVMIFLCIYSLEKIYSARSFTMYRLLLLYWLLLILYFNSTKFFVKLHTYYLEIDISGKSNGLWLNSLWFSTVLKKKKYFIKKFDIELVSQNIRQCVRNKLLLLRKFFCCNWKLTCNLFSIHYLLV